MYVGWMIVRLRWSTFRFERVVFLWNEGGLHFFVGIFFKNTPLKSRNETLGSFVTVLS